MSAFIFCSVSQMPYYTETAEICDIIATYLHENATRQPIQRDLQTLIETGISAA